MFFDQRPNNVILLVISISCRDFFIMFEIDLRQMSPVLGNKYADCLSQLKTADEHGPRERGRALLARLNEGS
jgi:hypothetical protein